MFAPIHVCTSTTHTSCEATRGSMLHKNGSMHRSYQRGLYVCVPQEYSRSVLWNQRGLAPAIAGMIADCTRPEDRGAVYVLCMLSAIVVSGLIYFALTGGVLARCLRDPDVCVCVQVCTMWCGEA